MERGRRDQRERERERERERGYRRICGHVGTMSFGYHSPCCTLFCKGCGELHLVDNSPGGS